MTTLLRLVPEKLRILSQIVFQFAFQIWMRERYKSGVELVILSHLLRLLFHSPPRLHVLQPMYRIHVSYYILLGTIIEFSQPCRPSIHNLGGPAGYKGCPLSVRLNDKRNSWSTAKPLLWPVIRPDKVLVTEKRFPSKHFPGNRNMLNPLRWVFLSHQ